MNNRNKMNKIFYGASVVLGLICCVLIVGIINNYRTINAINSGTTTGESATDEATSPDISATTTQEPTTIRETTTSPESPTNPNPNNNTNTGKKTVYLTFDDGPGDRTLEVLKVLDKYNVKATFFVIYHKDTEDILREIVNRGHTIGLHAYTHTYSEVYKSEAAFYEDLQKISDWVEGATGVKSMITRFPGGGSNTVSKKYTEGIMTSLTKGIREKGYQYFDWNCDSGDASGNNIPASTLVSRVKNSISSSTTEVCVLMHDSHAKKTTVEALPKIIEHFRDNGYDFGVLTVNTNGFHHTVNN